MSERNSFFNKGIVNVEGLIIKVVFEEVNEIRRMKLAALSWDILSKNLSSTFNRGEDTFTVRYKDEDGDLITISSDEEVQDMVRLVMATEQSKILRLYLSSKPTGGIPAQPTQPTWGHGFGNRQGYGNQQQMGHPQEHKHEHTRDDHRMYHHHGREYRGHGYRGHGYHGRHDRQFQGEGRYDKYRQKEMVKAEKQLWKTQVKHWKKAKRQDKLRMKKKKKLYARFVKHVTHPDGTNIAPNTRFVKTWRFRNEGSEAWPAGSRLLFISRLRGDQMNAPDYVPVPGLVLPDAEVDISVTMITPLAPGFYTSFWRLATSGGKKFGQRVWCKMQVTTGDEVVMQQPQAMDDDAQGMQTQSPMVGNTAPFGNTNPYMANEQQQTMASMLSQLRDMGFLDVQENIRMIKQYNGNLNYVVNALTFGNSRTK